VSFTLLLDTFQPFRYWSTQDYAPLPWYQAYHAVKHDRENKFNQATLTNVLEAISALATVLIAQYGIRAFHWKALIGQFFTINAWPGYTWREFYLPPFERATWQDYKALNN
jgi:hypothetical protein